MSSPMRGVASTALAVLGAVLVVLGSVALYAREEIFQPDAFADRAERTLDEEDVRDAVEEPIVDQAIDNGPDALINARPVLEAAVDGVVQSDPFHELFRAGAVRTHRALFEGEGEDLALSVEDANVIVAEAVTAVSPELGRQIPENVGAGLVDITESDLALTLARVAHDIRLLGLILPLGGVLLLAGSIALAPDRRRALLLSSASTAVAAILGFAALLIARSLVLNQFDDETISLAVAAVWEVFLGGLRTWLLLLGAGGILVAAAAAMGREVDATAPARALAGRALSPPSTAAGRLGRAVLIGAFGLLFVLRPGLALEIVAVLIGAYALFYAACEAMAVIAPAARPRGERRRLLPSPRVAVGGAALIGAIAVAIVAIAGGGDEGSVTRPAGPVARCNGFAELCDRGLNQVAFPATHNAMSAAGLPGWYQPNQRYGIQRQLDDGVRAFLIDSHPGIKRGTGPVLTDLEREGRSKVLEALRDELGPDAARRFAALAERFATRGGEGTPGSYLCHVVCELGSTEMTTALGWFRDFLDTHPDELLILFIEDYITPEETAEAFERSGILRYTYVHARDEPFPTLRELIESDRRLFVMAENDHGDGEYPWYHDGFELTQETPFDFSSQSELTGPRSCRPNRGDVHSPLFQVNHWVEKLPRSPSTAEQVNAFGFAMKRARRCASQRQVAPSWVAVDYHNKGDLVEVVRVLNQLPRDAEPNYRTTG